MTVQPLHRRFTTLPFALQVNYETDPEINAIYAWVAEHVPPGERHIVLVNGWDQCSGSALAWYLSINEQTLTSSKNPDEIIVEQFDLEIPSDETISRFAQTLDQHNIRYVLHLEGGPVSQAGAWWAYKAAIQDRSTEVAQQTFTVRLWDGKVLDHLQRNQVEPAQIETIQATLHYAIPVHATLFALSPDNRPTTLDHDVLPESITSTRYLLSLKE